MVFDAYGPPEVLKPADLPTPSPRGDQVLIRVHATTVTSAECGMRRGEIAALRWGSVDLDKGQLAVEQSAEQTKAGVQYKQPKSGQARTLALSPAVVAELKAHRLRLAEALLKLGKPLSGDDFVVMQADGQPYDPAGTLVEYSRGHGPDHALRPGKDVQVKDGMVFDVEPANRS